MVLTASPRARICEAIFKFTTFIEILTYLSRHYYAKLVNSADFRVRRSAGSLYREFLPENIHHKRGGIVAAGGGYRLVNENRSRLLGCVAQDILYSAVEEAIGYAIRAE